MPGPPPDAGSRAVAVLGVISLVLLALSLVFGLTGNRGWSNGTGAAGGLLLCAWAVAYNNLGRSR